MIKRKTPRISFEFFPPKSAESSVQLSHSAEQLSLYKPQFFSVTFGAGGSTLEGTVNTIESLQRQTKIKLAPHLSCIGLTKERLAGLLQQYKLLNVDRIVAIRGDLPSGMVAKGDIDFAVDLVQFIREKHGQHFHIEVAAYPECHPQAKHFADDIKNLKQKFLAGANGAITQYFFNTDAYFYFLDACAKENIDMPIVPGIMPILQFDRLVRFSQRCGAQIPQWLHKRLESYAQDELSQRNFIIDMLNDLCERLLTGGAPGLHFYTLNRYEICAAILNRFAIFASGDQKVVALGG